MPGAKELLVEIRDLLVVVVAALVPEPSTTEPIVLHDDEEALAFVVRYRVDDGTEITRTVIATGVKQVVEYFRTLGSKVLEIDDGT